MAKQWWEIGEPVFEVHHEWQFSGDSQSCIVVEEISAVVSFGFLASWQRVTLVQQLIDANQIISGRYETWSEFCVTHNKMEWVDVG